MSNQRLHPIMTSQVKEPRSHLWRVESLLKVVGQTSNLRGPLMQLLLCTLLAYAGFPSLTHAFAISAPAPVAPHAIVAFNPFIAIFVLLGILYFSVSIFTQVLRLLLGNYAGLALLIAFGGMSGVHLASTTQELLREEVESVAGRTHSEYFAGLAQEGGNQAAAYVSGLHGDISTSAAPAFEAIIGAAPASIRMGVTTDAASSVLSDGLSYALLASIALFLLAGFFIAFYRVFASALHLLGKTALSLRTKLLPGAGASSTVSPSWTDRRPVDGEGRTGGGEKNSSLSSSLDNDTPASTPPFQKARSVAQKAPVDLGRAVEEAYAVPVAADPSALYHPVAHPASHATASGSRLLASNPHVRLRSRPLGLASKEGASSSASEPAARHTPDNDPPVLDEDVPSLQIPYPRHPLWLYSLLPFLRWRLEKHFLEAEKGS